MDENFPAFFLLIKSKISARRKFTFFIIHKLGSSEILPLASVKDVTLKPSRIFKSRATVKIKTDERNYYFRLVIGADEAYGLILEKIQNNQG